jgi:hypothetical protein
MRTKKIRNKKGNRKEKTDVKGSTQQPAAFGLLPADGE